MRLARVQTDAGIRTIRIDGDDAVAITISDGGERLVVDDDRSGERWPFDPSRLVAPLRPGKIVAIGLNYHDHARESGMEVPQRPLIFAKFPNAVAGPLADIEIPDDITSVDYEGELAVVIGRRGRFIQAERAMEHVFGVTVANDVSARDAQLGDGQWTRGKSLDAFCPLGPWVTSIDEVGDVHDLPITTRVNGEIRQASNTAQMIFKIPDIIAYCSNYFTLDVGDLILTGTPAGVGLGRTPPLFLAAGDVVEVEIGALGVIRNTIRSVTTGVT
jgi:5-carboxymethyl-2-hydroxymuconate isomerase